MQAEIEPLLKLQENDRHLLEIEAQLAHLPREIAQAEKKIAEEQAAIDVAHEAVKAEEVRRKDLDNDLKSAEAQLIKFKNQQLDVKKNEEYVALNHEISATETKIGEIEEREILSLMAIDDAKAAHDKAQQEHGDLIAAYQADIQRKQEEIRELEAELDAAKAAVAAAEPAVDPKFLTAYGRVKQQKVRAPWVVSVTQHKCNGCHIKLDGEVESQLLDPTGPVHCSSCGRILYTH